MDVKSRALRPDAFIGKNPTTLSTLNKKLGLSLFLVEMREKRGGELAKGLSIKPIRTMINHSSTQVFFDNLSVPASNLIGDEGMGFHYLLDGLNAERILIASECLGDCEYFINKSTEYGKTRKVFGREIAKNQGVQFPIARAYMAKEAARLMVEKATSMYDRGEKCGAEANMAKYLASQASWTCAEVCFDTFGGFSFAEEYDIERKW
eukprot:CAMPEP_0174256920 /NCGR_PEP_ID=MMETSP0439-20130205/6122_1 /TAXON_ID=0 /ORGANISM="Stereomyxa ramosa, Strain Chinc5" /LENGTH=206 /DNA_ID=CAMNT_0015339771 /DNA_START=559 /DNA_END=1177 /DNA_ORIENTATION=+